MKRRLTFRRVFDNHTYRFDEPKISICFDSCHPDEEPNALIIEAEKNVLFENGRYIEVKTNEHHYIVGEVANRLYEYEQLGYFPDELKEIIKERKELKERLNSLHGAATFNMNVESLYPRVLIENVGRRNGKTLAQAMTKALINNRYGIDNVIFNDPATIIFWADGTKTVVKAEGEDFDPEKGLAMAISKKALGNKGNYFDIFKKWTKNYKPGTRRLTAVAGKSAFEGFADGMRQAAEAARKLAKETRDDAVEGNLFLASDELRSVLNRKKTTKNDMVKSIRYALERLDHARLYFIKKKEN